MPLFAGIPSQTQAEKLRTQLKTSFQKNENWLLCPSCAHDEPAFNPVKYWRGPVWINVNWMLFHGLASYGFFIESEQIKQDSLALVDQHGSYEYFDPRPDSELINNRGIGADLFSWTAALYLDFTMNQQKL